MSIDSMSIFFFIHVRRFYPPFQVYIFLIPTISMWWSLLFLFLGCCNALNLSSKPVKTVSFDLHRNDVKLIPNLRAQPKQQERYPEVGSLHYMLEQREDQIKFLVAIIPCMWRLWSIYTYGPCTLSDLYTTAFLTLIFWLGGVCVFAKLPTFFANNDEDGIFELHTQHLSSKRKSVSFNLELNKIKIIPNIEELRAQEKATAKNEDDIYEMAEAWSTKAAIRQNRRQEATPQPGTLHYTLNQWETRIENAITIITLVWRLSLIDTYQYSNTDWWFGTAFWLAVFKGGSICFFARLPTFFADHDDDQIFELVRIPAAVLLLALGFAIITSD